MEFQTICILGLGYIGLPTASTFAAHGLKVIGVDTNQHIVDTLQNGQVHIHEPGIREVLRQALGSGNLIIASRPEPADAFIIAVPTPFYDDKKADLSFIRSAAESILPYLRKGNLVVLESTSPPLTTTQVVAPILEKSGLQAGRDFFLAYSPERVLPGQILRELVENARVIGGVDRASAEAGRDLYAYFVRGEIYLTNATTAEMVKLMENTYRDVNIAIANEFSRLADKFGVDVWEAIELANRHPRVKILRPGPGVGGHCISVDPWFLVEAAPEIANVILASRHLNDSQPRFVLELVRRAAGGLAGKKVAALGLAYKPDVDDLRESPAIAVCRLLQGAGADVRAYEPFKPDYDQDGLRSTATLGESVRDADVLLLLVGHTQFKELDPREVARISPARVAVDTIAGWDASAWEAAGFDLTRLGGVKRA
jgi:UDP-N-acetyl-D-mannosaminuronic acid dehydrogenase